MKKIEDVLELNLLSNETRQNIIKMLYLAKSGHPAGPLGLADLFTVLYFNIMNHDPTNPNWDKRDRFVLSNGHVCPVLYASLARAGYFPIEKLDTLRKLGSPLQGHPHKGPLPGIENSSGPLGQGISQAVGMAIVGKRENAAWKVYCVLGDGELNEGQVWEALLLAAKYKLDNLVAVIDRNDIQIDGTSDDVLPLEPLGEKFRSFGCVVVEVDGNDVSALLRAFKTAHKVKNKPTILIANTIPGKGVSFMEGKFEWHGRPPNEDEKNNALAELKTLRSKLETHGSKLDLEGKQ